MINFDRQMQVCEQLIGQWHRRTDPNISISIVFPVYNPANGFSEADLAEIKYMSHTARDMSKKYNLLFMQDGHRQGTILFAHQQLNLLGIDALFSHTIDISPAEIELCAQTGTRNVHNPSEIMPIIGRCPVPELLDAGVTVSLGSDGVAPERSYDMFRHMFQCMHYHRTYFHDPSYLPAGKVLEMVTIDAATCPGMQNEIGSLEVGKKADIILVDLYKPHLVPLNMAPYRIAHYTNGGDVDSVFINGKILMEKRRESCVDEGQVLDLAQTLTDRTLARRGLKPLLELPQCFWGHAGFPAQTK